MRPWPCMHLWTPAPLCLVLVHRPPCSPAPAPLPVPDMPPPVPLRPRLLRPLLTGPSHGKPLGPEEGDSLLLSPSPGPLPWPHHVTRDRGVPAPLPPPGTLLATSPWPVPTAGGDEGANRSTRESRTVKGPGPQGGSAWRPGSISANRSPSGMDRTGRDPQGDGGRARLGPQAERKSMLKPQKRLPGKMAAQASAVSPLPQPHHSYN